VGMVPRTTRVAREVFNDQTRAGLGQTDGVHQATESRPADRPGGRPRPGAAGDFSDSSLVRPGASPSQKRERRGLAFGVRHTHLTDSTFDDW